VWAPTAQAVNLRVYSAGGTSFTRVPMTRSEATGVWSRRGGAPWTGRQYLYEVKVFSPASGKVETNVVTDPYSLALTTNSQRSIVVDLRDPRLAPAGWRQLAKPKLRQGEDSNIWELHIRDFSITDETVPAAERGTYKAFTRTNSDGMKHVRGLAKSGLNTVHLLPAFDIATIEERRSAQKQPACNLPALPRDSEKQQECVTAVAGQDGFNWGYDPWHYTAPEGSYATNPNGTVRNREFREMVAALNRSGLRVVMDVVYNHTAAAGQDAKSVLDRVVPGYYHRLNATGKVETSTCCSNTATEHMMMGKLTVDSIVTWARDYKVDGFRFDLMGHHPKRNILDVRRALNALTLAKDGVDGRGIYLYGEAGTSARSLTTPASSRRRSSTWPGRASVRSTTDSATPCAAAVRSTRTRACRASAPASSPTRPATRTTRSGSTATRSASGSPATCATTSCGPA
jgi:pullulanase-type alpha-1,6-glucosidase